LWDGERRSGPGCEFKRVSTCSISGKYTEKTNLGRFYIERVQGETTRVKLRKLQKKMIDGKIKREKR
jgi:hypothetical protein